MLKFYIVGDQSSIAHYHRKAIEHVGGEIVGGSDRDYQWNDSRDVDYVVICTPSYLHMEHIKEYLPLYKIIVEKPMCLPWEPIVDDNRINIVMQLRYLEDLEYLKHMKVNFVRDKAYMNTWKGSFRKSGGLFYSLFIHYIDLAIRYGATFTGSIHPAGEQRREFDFEYNIINLEKIDMQGCYNRMYEDIVEGKGIKPRDIFYLHWVMNRELPYYNNQSGYVYNYTFGGE